MMNRQTLQAVIVDDRADARNHLKQLLERRFDVQVVGEAEGISDAVALCNDLHPNLIFLDIELGGKTGFSLLEKLDPLPAIIFVTGYSEYAVRAFEVNAVDYLLKPVDPRRLSDAIERIHQAPSRTQTKQFAPNDPIILEWDKKARVIFVSQIVGVVGAENYTEVLIADGSMVFMRRKFSKWEELLPESLFLSPDRSLIVNLKAVRNLTLISRDKITFLLEAHDREFELGRKPAARLRQALRHARGV
jgi:two-component system LytT family response regulator